MSLPPTPEELTALDEVCSLFEISPEQVGMRLRDVLLSHGLAPEFDLHTLDHLYQAGLSFHWRRIAYAEYLLSGWWQFVRRRALDQARYCCQLCNDDGLLDVHHRTYERLGCELPEDLIVLCRPCHSLFHGKLPRKDEHE